MNETVKTILEASGYKIPPYRMNCMVKDVSKICSILLGTGPISYTADEARVILDMVEAIRSKAVTGR